MGIWTLRGKLPRRFLVLDSRKTQRFCFHGTQQIPLTFLKGITGWPAVSHFEVKFYKSSIRAKESLAEQSVGYAVIRQRSTKSSSGSSGPPPASGERAKFTSFFVAASIVIGFFAYQLYSIRLRFSTLLPPQSDLLPRPPTSEDYIYVYDPYYGEAARWKGRLFPWLIQGHDPAFRIARRLAEDTRSKDPERRRKAIALLSELVLEDYHCDQLAQYMDVDTSIGLAHSEAMYRLIPSHGDATAKYPDQTNLGQQLRDLLKILPSGNIHQRVHAGSDAAVKLYTESDDVIDLWFQDHVALLDPDSVVGVKVFHKKKLSEPEFLIPCLQAILSHSRILEIVSILLRSHIIELLLVIAEKYRHKDDIMELVVKILANLSCDPGMRSYIKDTGLIRLLAELAASPEIKLCLPAKRALHNLDRDSVSPILPPGMYQLYPDFRSDENNLDVDIVFVHGLLGGVFRTWRREDQVAVMKMTSAAATKPGYGELITEKLHGAIAWTWTRKDAADDDQENSLISRTWSNGEWTIHYEDDESSTCPLGASSQCWPRDWLPEDVPNARILAVNFDSFVSHWSNAYPLENTGRSLYERTTELMEKLVSSGVGNRPVVWVAHSMGGLLVKQLLTRSAESTNEQVHKISENTRGVAFLSVPHFGSNVAAKTTAGVARILMPTVEVKELVYGSDRLKSLNEEFLRLRRANHYKVISFGETKEVPFSSLGVKLMLVPLSSADPRCGDFYSINVNHLNICKVRSRDAFVYQKIVDLVDHVLINSENWDNGETSAAPSLFHAPIRKRVLSFLDSTFRILKLS